MLQHVQVEWILTHQEHIILYEEIIEDNESVYKIK